MEKLTGYVAHIRRKIDGNFSEFDQLLADQESFLQAHRQQHQEIKGHLDEVDKRIS